MGKHSAPRPRALAKLRTVSAHESAATAVPDADARDAHVVMQPETPQSDPAQSETTASETTRSETAQPPDSKPARKRRSLVRRVVFAVVTMALVASTLAFTNLSKSVRVVVDGKTETVSTYAVDVSGVLADSDVKTANRDLVSPATSSVIKDGQTVTVTHARPITLNIDGQKSTKWVAALTVDEALDQLGLADHGVTASRSSRIPIDGESLALSAPKSITVTADGQTQVVMTTAATAESAVTEAGIPLSDTDQLSVPRDTPITSGLTVSITRVSIATIPEQRPVPFTTTEAPDPNEYVGINRTLSAGQNGLSEVTVQVQSTNGVETGRTDIATSIVTAPVDAGVVVGARQFPADVEALNWPALSMCESTNNPRAVNKTNGKYFGQYQFSVATWASVGGTGSPVDASPEEQLARAKMLYMRSGAGQWECGSRLFD